MSGHVSMHEVHPERDERANGDRAAQRERAADTEHDDRADAREARRTADA